MKEVYAEILTHIAAYLVGLATALLIRRSADRKRMDGNAELCGTVSDNIGQSREPIKSAEAAARAIQSEIDRSREEFGEVEDIIRRINERNGIAQDPDKGVEDHSSGSDGVVLGDGCSAPPMN